LSNFDSTKQSLPKILGEIVEGQIQLPDFQRGWIWDDEHVRSLLVSIARSFPIGAVMLLETGGDVRFQVRPIENVTLEGDVEPEQLILDGQQRLTSLTQVLMLDGAVQTFDEKKKKIERYYYLDVRMALEEGMIEEAFIAIDKDKTKKTNFGRDLELDLRTRELECKQLYFPCNQILNSDSWEESLNEFAPEHFGLYMQFRKKILAAFRSYQLPIIALKKATTKEAVCLVFEKVNTGGVPLSVFELITATYAADGFNLRDDWFGSDLRKINGRVDRLKQEAILQSVESTDFLQAITLLHTFEKRQQDIKDGKSGKMISAVSAKRAAVLSLSLEAYKQWADPVEAGFILAAKFLRKQCFYKSKDLPYRSQLPPLAAVLTRLQERWLEPRIYDKLSRWFWCGVIGELYGGAVESRMANDLEELLPWLLEDAEEPRTIYGASFQPDRLHTLRTRLSAAYKGINTLVLREGAKDFFWKASIQELDAEEVSLDFHHIFPKAWCESQGIKPSVFNSIINKTPISYKANRMIGGKAPSAYLTSVQSHEQVKLDDAGMNDLLESHLIEPEYLREDNFELFFEQRKEELVKLVAEAMGREIEYKNEPYDDSDED